MAGYKSATTTRIDDWIDEHNLPIPKFNRNNPLWHRDYYDHVIRSKHAFFSIKSYVCNNPRNWRNDTFF